MQRQAEGARYLRDIVAVLAALLLGAALVAGGDATGPVPGIFPWQVDVMVGVAAILGLPLRRSRPVAFAVVVVPLTAVSVMATGAVLGALFRLALRRGTAQALAAAAAYLATAPVYVVFSGSSSCRCGPMSSVGR